MIMSEAVKFINTSLWSDVGIADNALQNLFTNYCRYLLY